MLVNLGIELGTAANPLRAVSQYAWPRNLFDLRTYKLRRHNKVPALGLPVRGSPRISSVVKFAFQKGRLGINGPPHP